jgi:hypothetical protein
MQDLSYSGQDFQSLTTDFHKDANELSAAGQYEHSLTLIMLKKAFLKAGGISNEADDYSYSICSVKHNVRQKLNHIGHMNKVDQARHIVKEKLAYKNICSLAEWGYRNGNPWGMPMTPR